MKKEEIVFRILEALIVLSIIISVLFLYGFSPIYILYGITIGLLYGTVLLLCIIWTYYTIKGKKVAFAIGAIITVLIALFMLVDMITIFKTPLWFDYVIIILSIIDVLYFIITISIRHLKKQKTRI